MSVRSETSGEIAAGVDVVYRYVSDVSRWPEWAKGIEKCEVSGGGVLEAGARLDQRVKGSGSSAKERHLDVTMVEPPGRLEFAGAMGGSPLRWGFELTPVGSSSTRVVLWVEVDRRGVLQAMPAGILRRMIRGTNQRELAVIRSGIEAATARK